MESKAIVLASPLLLLAAACSSSSGKAPVVASAGGHDAYAIRYDEELTTATKSAADAQTREKTLTGGFGGYVDQLKKPDWTKVDVVIDDSDDAGKSADYADAANDGTGVRAFWESEKGEITARVNSGAQDKLKESGCSGDVSGAISYSLDDAIKKRLQKRLRARNDAFVVIERNRTAMGPNAAVLEKLADDVAESSYAVHVLMPLQRNKLQRLVADKSDVKKTLDRYIKEETDLQAEPGRSDADKKASQDRVTAANKKKAQIDDVSAQAEAAAKDMDKSIDAATKDYDDALKALKAKVAEKKKSPS